MTRGMFERPSHRRAKVGKVIIRALAQVFNEQSFHSEAMIITLSEVKMSTDLRVAHIYFRCITFGSANELKLNEVTSLLQRRTALIRRQLAARVYLKFLPELRFHYDERLGKAHTF